MFWVKKILKGIVLFLIFASIFSFLVMWLWNLIVPAVTGWTALTFGRLPDCYCLVKYYLDSEVDGAGIGAVIPNIIISGSKNGMINYHI